MKALKLILLIPLFFLMACSAAYDQVKELDIKNPNTFQQHILNNYQINIYFSMCNLVGGGLGKNRTYDTYLFRVLLYY